MGCKQRLIRTVFLPRFSRLFCLLSSIILQINLLYLYVVTIRRYKLSFFAKPPTKSLPHFSVFKNSWREANNPPGAGTSQIYLSAKFGGNSQATGSNAKFCEFFWLEVLKLLCLQDRATIYESRCLRRVRLNMICNAAKK